MICEECKKRNASVYINQNTHDKSKTIALCDECASAQKIPPPSPDTAPEPKIREGSCARCSVCHTTLSSVESSKNLTLGCPECYVHFENEIANRLSFKHGRLIYSARVPLRQRREAKREEYLTKLRDEMANAVANEDFERALTLREMIKCVV